ncbi:hypothetical protein U9M48_007169 [Paspalum notatum var. saurae]|uniref:Uncharacterized protein n=1 Tax=Paspalum notatum var. saurae TaxID=547442 RepID=A0AAQ3PTS1_PASNO
MSTTPRARGRSSSHHRARCKCLGVGGGNKGDRATPCCSFNPLRSLFRCPGRDRSRRSRSKHRQRAPSRVRDAPVAAGAQAQQQTQEEEPSFFVYAMPNQQGGFGGGGGGGEKHKKTRRGKPRMPSFGSCFRRNKKKRKQQATAGGGRRPALTPAASLLTHPPGSPAPEKAQAVTPSVTQPPSPSPTENGSAVTSPAPRGRQPATPRPAKQSTDSAHQSPFALQTQQQQPKQVEGLEIVEVATGERLSTHELGLIEMVGSSLDNSAESSVKSSLEYVSEPPPQRTVKRTMAEREAVVVKEVPKLWLNGTSAESRARERFAEPLVTTAAEELWAHDVACSRVHAVMLAETVSCSSS